MKPLIQLQNIHKYYGKAPNLYHAIRGISLDIQEGEFVAVIGPSGSGKSTLMNIIGCLDTYEKGSYILDNVDISKLKDHELAKYRGQKIGFIFQSFNLINRYSILDNVLLPSLYIKLDKPLERAMELLNQVGLENKATRTPLEISGGERQRVAIARALLTNPDIILADEPTGNLDSKTGEKIMMMLQDLHKQEKTIVLITHDMQIAQYAQRQVKIKDGKLDEGY